jgi:hypothetical protein
MGARRGLGAAALAVVLLAARAEAATVWEPIARLSVEGGYDSNVLYDGSGGDRMSRLSPEVGLRLLGRRLDLRAGYGGDWVTYQELQPEGTWNHRAALQLDARVTRRIELSGRLRGSYAYDPVGLALLGVFRSGNEAALVADGRFRAEWRATERVEVAAALTEETVQFEDRTGGAMHAPAVEALWRSYRRIDLGGAYRLGVFQSFEAEPLADEVAFAHGLRARARWRATRRLTLDAYAGPALWRGSETTEIVPEASLQLVGSGRGWDLRASVAHGLALGSTARPGLVDAIEAGGRRRLGARFELRGEGGVWRSGTAPSGGDATTGWAVSGEGALLVGGGVRLALVGTHFANVDGSSPTLRRTTLGLRLGWELPLR